MQVDNPGWLVEVSMLLVFSLVTVYRSIERNQQEVFRHLRVSLAQPIGASLLIVRGSLQL